jgi:hypothetical protein
MNNPLSDFYREKSIFVKLPTGGKWYKQKPKLTADGEIGIMPMTMKDEMLFKIPDSLYNGESLYEVLKSIVPDIADPYEISIPDVDVILLASRAVSTDTELPIDAKCPHCGEITSYSINIPAILSKIKSITSDTEVEIKNLVIKLRPNTLASVTASSMQGVESARLLAAVGTENSDNKNLLQRSLEKATAAGIGVLADSIESIQLPDGTIVTDQVHIMQWVANSDSTTTNVIKKLSMDLNKNGIQNEFPFSCSNEECAKEFVSSVEFNPTFFFTKK